MRIYVGCLLVLIVLLSGVFFIYGTQEGKPVLLKIAHRGASGYEPENTIRSFEKAIALGADMIELDVYVCATGELVVMHDPTVDRTTNGHGKVEEMSLHQLAQLDAGKGEHIPTLQDVFDIVDRRCAINIELKGSGTAVPVAELIQEYVQHRGWSYADFVVSSFDHHELLAFHKKLPAVKTGALLEAIPYKYASFGQDIGAHYVVLYYESINKEFVDDAHKRGMQVLVYTVNDPRDIQTMKALGVDGIISNYPDRISL